MSDDTKASFGLILDAFERSAKDTFTKDGMQQVGLDIAYGLDVATGGRYSSMWNDAQRDMELDDDRSADGPTQNIAGTTVQQTGSSRLTLSTPFPDTTVVLGKPSADFGYPGLSMSTSHYWFVNVDGRTRFQHSAPVTYVANKQWWLYAMKDMAIATDASAILAARRRLIVSAGGGYGAYPVTTAGSALPDESWTNADLEDILDPAHWGLREFDARQKELEWDHKSRFGFEVPPVRPVGTPPALSKSQRYFGGWTPPPTEHSERIARLLNLKTDKILAVLEKIGRFTDRLSRWVNRPDVVPFIGPVFFQKYKDFKNFEWGLRESFSVMQVGGAWNKMDASRGGMFSSWDGFSAWAASMKDLINRVKRLTNAVKEMALALADFLGMMAPDPSVLGLVGRDGVSMVTHNDLFAWAPNGFYFVSARNADDYPTDPMGRFTRNMLAAQKYVRDKIGPGALSNFLFGKENDVPVSDASFRVFVDDDIKMRSNADIEVSAFAGEGHLRLEGGKAVELASAGTVGVLSRDGAVEVIGRTVTVGAPLADAKKASEAALRLEALRANVTATRAGKEEAAERVRKAKTDLQELKAEARKLKDEAAGLGVADMNKAMQLAGSLTAVGLKIIAGQKELDASQLAHGAAEKAYLSAKRQLDTAKKSEGAVLSKSAVAKEMKWEPKSQALAEKLSMGGVRETEIFGGRKIAVESQKAIDIVVETTPPAEPSKASIKVTTSIEIEVGTFKVTVSKDKVVINNGAKDVVVVNANGIALQGTADAKISALGSEVNLDAPLNANIKAGGRVILG